MRKHCQGQQGKCPQCAKNIQCSALFLTSLAVCSVYSSKQNKARTQAESWATVIFTSLLLACSLAQFWLPRRLTLPVRAWPWFRGKLMLMVTACRQPPSLGEPEHWHMGKDESWHELNKPLGQGVPGAGTAIIKGGRHQLLCFVLAKLSFKKQIVKHLHINTGVK